MTHKTSRTWGNLHDRPRLDAVGVLPIYSGNSKRAWSGKFDPMGTSYGADNWGFDAPNAAGTARVKLFHYRIARLAKEREISSRCNSSRKGRTAVPRPLRVWIEYHITARRWRGYPQLCEAVGIGYAEYVSEVAIGKRWITLEAFNAILDYAIAQGFAADESVEDYAMKLLK